MPNIAGSLSPCDQRNFDTYFESGSKLTWHPSMILAKYLSAESVERQTEKTPREREHCEHLNRPEKQLKLAESTVFVC